MAKNAFCAYWGELKRNLCSKVNKCTRKPGNAYTDPAKFISFFHTSELPAEPLAEKTLVRWELSTFSQNSFQQRKTVVMGHSTVASTTVLVIAQSASQINFYFTSWIEPQSFRCSRFLQAVFSLPANKKDIFLAQAYSVSAMNVFCSIPAMSLMRKKTLELYKLNDWWRRTWDLGVFCRRQRKELFLFM